MDRLADLRRTAALARFALHAHPADGDDQERHRLYVAAVAARQRYEAHAGDNAPLLPELAADPDGDMLPDLAALAQRIRTRTAA